MEAHVESARAPQHRPLVFLDRLLSEPLRSTAPSELARCRIMAGASLSLFVSCLFYLLTEPALPNQVSAAIAALGYLGTLLLLRSAVSATGPSWLLCLSLMLGFLGPIFLDHSPFESIHAADMLLPALAVYLLGPRAGLGLTFVLMVALGLLFPLYYGASDTTLFLGAHELWHLHASAAIAFLGAWGLGALHSTSWDATQALLEQTLKQLSDSEGKLLSLIESTDDLVCSLDLEGRLIIANTALKKFFLRRLGREPIVGKSFFTSSNPERQAQWQQRFAQVISGQCLHFEEEHSRNGERFSLDISINPIFDKTGRVTGMTIFSRDITARKEAEIRQGEMHRTLVDVSRQAGMAEIATGVLHNVGNTLNSVNISTAMLAELVRKSRVSGLAKAAQLLREQRSELGTFLVSDPQGKKLPDYLIALSDSLVEEREALNKEVLSLTESVEHIKSIVSTQQKHARTAGAIEELQVPQLLDEALRLEAVSLERQGIFVERDYGDVPPILVDRHKLLQILINLLSNARHALVDSQNPEKRLIIRVRTAPESERLLIEVTDNGMGISPENLPRIFTQGFTTKKTGHGFGLHISALTATEMKGRLTCSSPGLAQGATFTLELPVTGEEVRL